MAHGTLPGPRRRLVTAGSRAVRIPVVAVSLLGVSLLGLSACSSPPPVTTTVPAVDLERYLGTWYEVGSVKQFFSIGLVNTAAVYSLNPDGTVRVENSGNYFFGGGPQSRIVGSAVPVDSTNARLNVTFVGTASPNPPGNYWIVDLDPDYQWAIVSDPSGSSGFLLSRVRNVTPEFYAELVERAAAAGVNVSNLTPTLQV